MISSRGITGQRLAREREEAGKPYLSIGLPLTLLSFWRCRRENGNARAGGMRWREFGGERREDLAAEQHGAKRSVMGADVSVQRWEIKTMIAAPEVEYRGDDGDCVAAVRDEHEPLPRLRHHEEVRQVTGITPAVVQHRRP
jgi:hypothetical protein